MENCHIFFLSKVFYDMSVTHSVTGREVVYGKGKNGGMPSSLCNNGLYMNNVIQHTIYHEMVLDLCYRLRLADDVFCEAADAIVSAMKNHDFAEKERAIGLVHDYSRALQVIYVDFARVIHGCHVVFPAEVAAWQWNEPEGDSVMERTVERLHAIAESMEMKAHAEVLKAEVTA